MVRANGADGSTQCSDRRCWDYRSSSGLAACCDLAGQFAVPQPAGITFCTLVSWDIGNSWGSRNLLLSRRFTGWYLLTLVLASLPKLGLIFLLPIKPQSDMWSYNFEAQMLLARFSWQDLFDKQWLDFSVISPHVFHISSTFHWIYWLTFSHYQVIQLVNIVLVAICSWLIFVLLRRIVSRTAGLIGGLIFFFIPSNYVYSCLMGAEYFQLTAFLLALLGLYRLITSDHGRFWRAALGLIVCLLLVNFYRQRRGHSHGYRLVVGLSNWR